MGMDALLHHRAPAPLTANEAESWREIQAPLTEVVGMRDTTFGAGKLLSEGLSALQECLLACIHALLICN